MGPQLHHFWELRLGPALSIVDSDPDTFPFDHDSTELAAGQERDDLPRCVTGHVDCVSRMDARFLAIRFGLLGLSKS